MVQSQSSPQEKLITFLKKKGTGSTMSKSLMTDELLEIECLFKNEAVHLTTKATIFTALILLKPNADEEKWLKKIINNPRKFLPPKLQPLLPNTKTTDPFLKLTHQVIQHQNLSQKEFLIALEYLFNPSIPEHYKAAFLEAERLKSESEEENLTCLLDFINRSSRQRVDLPVLIDLANPYDGFNRTPNLSPFLAALLSSIGIPVLLHGVENVSPKYGITPIKLLKKVNHNLPLSIPDILSRIQDDHCGWAYIDQEQSFPELFNLLNLRKNMVKRPILATIEKLLCPIYSNFNHLLVTGYTHPPYRQKTIKLYQHHPLIKEGLIIRGVEGSSQLPLDRRAPLVRVNDQDSQESFITPEKYNIKKNTQKFTQPISLEENIEMGIAALKGQNGWAKDQLIYQSLVIIDSLDLKPPEEALSALCLSIETGMALKHWQSGL